MPKYQATSYIRLSYTDDRSSESDSVTNQRKLIENFIVAFRLNKTPGSTRGK